MAQKVLSFKKKARLTVMNMHSKLLNNHSVHLPLSAGGGWVEPPTKFSKKAGELDRNSAFRGGWLGKRWVTLFRGVGVGGVQFSHKNKSKSELFNAKRSL